MISQEAKKINVSFMVPFSVVSTSTPHNDAELQLYRVLQKASLLAYYDTLLEMGKFRFEASFLVKRLNKILVFIRFDYFVI